MIRSAHFSDCRRWRYTLHRIWDEGSPYCQFIGLNPSTANETDDDPTVRRCIRYAQSWGYGGLVMTNAFAWRDTDPKGMKAQPDPIGPNNDAWLVAVASGAGMVVAAWGAHGAHMGRGNAVKTLLADSDLHVLGLTNCGHPRHPLYLRADLRPVPWREAVMASGRVAA